jgi:hypothetical protein
MMDVKVATVFFIKVKFANEDLLASPHDPRKAGVARRKQEFKN